MKLKRKQIVEIQSMTKEELGALINMISLAWSYAHPIDKPKSKADKIKIVMNDDKWSQTKRLVKDEHDVSHCYVARNLPDFYDLCVHAQDEKDDDMAGFGKGAVVILVENGIITKREVIK